MKKYDQYIKTGYKFLPLLPKSWELKLGRSCFEENKRKNSDLKERLLLQFKYGTIIRKASQEIKKDDEAVLAKYTVVEPNDIMLNGLNLNYDFISQRVGIVEEKGTITSAYLALRCRDLYNPFYANYMLKALDSQKIFHGMGSGVRLTLGYPEFSRIQFPVPSRNEQDQIVRYLDWQVSKINRLIHGYQKQIKLLDERKTTVINDAVTHGIHTDVEMQAVEANWVKEIPMHWEFNKVKQHFEIKKRIAGKEGYDVISITQQGLKVKDISSNEGQMAANYSKYQFVYPGDYAMNHMDLLTGFIGLSEFFGVTSPDYRVFSAIDVEKTDLKYYLYVFQLGYKRKIFYGLGRGAANKGRWRMPAMNFKNYDIPVPPIEEQQEIVAYIEKETGKIDSLKKEVEKQIELLKEYRTRLISDVVTGQIDVRDVVIPEYIPEEDTEIDTNDAGEDVEEVAEDAE